MNYDARKHELKKIVLSLVVHGCEAPVSQIWRVEQATFVQPGIQMDAFGSIDTAVKLYHTTLRHTPLLLFQCIPESDREKLV